MGNNYGYSSYNPTVPIGSSVVPFYGPYLESYKVLPKLNYEGAYGQTYAMNLQVPPRHSLRPFLVLLGVAVALRTEHTGEGPSLPGPEKYVE